MTDLTSNKLVDDLADEFIMQLRNGERPTVADYVRRYPEHAEEIKDIFPSIEALEHFKNAEDIERHRLEQRNRFVKTPFQRIGEFEIVRPIGRGGMGLVLEAIQPSLGRRVALKVLSSDVTASPHRLERFRREAKSAAGLHHTNIVPVFGVGQDEDTHFYVMQLIDGVGLDNVIKNLRRLISQDAPAAESDNLPHEPSGESWSSFSAMAAASALRSGSFAQFHSDSQIPQRWGGSPSSSRIDRRRTDEPFGAIAETESYSSIRPGEPMDPAGTPSGPDPSDQLPSAAGGSSRVALDANQFDERYWRSVARIGVQAADAIQHAHSQRVLHRDIKPANLLLDWNGLVWVTDFGLAKSLEHTNVTHSGDLVGTLRYMAPEQINGHSDTRVDVYSLGITLFELITLRPAFSENKHARLIEQITREGPPRPSSLNPGVPRDLETIVLKAAAIEPVDRYPTAAALAEDLQRYLDDRPITARPVSIIERLWRWCRRNPAVAVPSCAATLFLIAIAVVATIGSVRTNRALALARAEERRAEQNLKVALQMFEEIIDNVALRGAPQSFELQPEGADGIYANHYLSQADAQLLQNPLKFFNQLAKQNGDGLQIERAAAYRRVGQIYQRLGQYDAAAGAYSSALQKYTDLPAQQRNEINHIVARAQLRNQIGAMYLKSGHIAEARYTYRTAVERLLLQPAYIVQNNAIRFELGKNYIALASIGRLVQRSQGSVSQDHQDSPVDSTLLAYQRNAFDLLQQLVEQDPTNPEYRLAMAQYYRTRVSSALQDGQLVEADEALDEAIRILRLLVRDFRNHPNQRSYRMELAETLLIRTFDSAPQSASSDYRQRVEDAVTIGRELQRESPHAYQYRTLLAAALSHLAWIQYQSGEVQPAEESYEQAIGYQRELANMLPEVPLYQVALAESRLALGDFRRQYERFDDSRLVLEQALNDFRESSAQHSYESSYQRLLRNIYLSLADTLQQLSQRQAASKNRRLAREITELLQDG